MRKPFLLKPFFIFLFTIGIVFVSNTISFGQFLEEYGNIGTLKTFKGQVRDAADGLIPNAIIQFTNLNSEVKKSVETDDNGVFKIKSLSSGKYKVKVEIRGFNPTEFTVIINSSAQTSSNKFIIIRLSPGCASGGSVELESKIKKE